jgi:hypothetical protein
MKTPDVPFNAFGVKAIRMCGRIVLMLAVCALVLFPATSIAAEHFDGNWHTKLTCPPKGDTEGYTWQFPSVIENNNLRGEHGTAGQPGYLLIEGKVAEDGNVKVTANGIVASRKYARGIFAAKGEEYSWDVKVHFTENEGSGTRSTGLGIVGRPCTLEFVKQAAASETVPDTNAPHPATPSATAPK